MSQPDGADHWAELASQLGAELPAADHSSSQAGPETSPSAEQGSGSAAATAGSLGTPPVSSPSGSKSEAAKPAAKPAKRKPISVPPTRSAADWDLLAEELGIAPRATSGEGSLGKIATRVELFDAPEPPVAQSSGADAPPAEFDEGSSRDQRTPLAVRSSHGEPAAVPSSTELAPSARSSTAGPPRSRTEDEARGGSTKEPADFGAGLFDAEPPKRRGAHEEEAESGTTAPRSKRRRRRRKKSGGLDGSVVSDPAPAAEPRGEASTVEPAEPADGATDSVSASGMAGDGVDAPVEPGEAARPEKTAPRRAADDDDGSDEEDDEKESRFIHRGVPTWSEAIGMIIDTNMEARAKRPNGTGGSRGRGGRRNRNSPHKG